MAKLKQSLNSIEIINKWQILFYFLNHCFGVQFRSWVSQRVLYAKTEKHTIRDFIE